MRRHIWPVDFDIDDLFDSPSMGLLWLRGVDMGEVMDASRQSAADILGTTPKALEAAEMDTLRRMFPPQAS